MSTQPPVGIVFPLQLAKSNACWRGRVAGASFERLGGLLKRMGPVDVDLEFAPIDRSSCRVTGRADVDATIECQACAEEVTVTVAAEIDFRVVRSEQQARETASIAEPFLLEEESITVAALIEDDLIMSLPGRGCEATADCPNRPAFAYPADGDAARDRGQEHPFAVLEQLKQREE